MKRTQYARVEDLEARKLLSTVPAASAQSTTQAVLVPLNLTGTLAVDMGEATTTQNVDSSTTTAVPVSGRLGTLGKVQGVWSETVDELGDYEGPDTIVLQTHKPKGSLTVGFNNDNSGSPKPIGHSTSIYQHAQNLVGSSSAFNKSSEHGSIELLMSNKTKSYESLVLISVAPTTTAIS